MKDLLDWLAPTTEHPGRTRTYHRLILLFGAVPAAWWLLSMVPPAYTILVALVVLVVLLAWGFVSCCSERM